MTQVEEYDDLLLAQVSKHVKDVRDFMYHLMVYVFVNTLMIILDRAVGPNDGFLGLDWAFWLILFWGIGLAGHAISVFFGDYRVQKVYRQQAGTEFVAH